MEENLLDPDFLIPLRYCLLILSAESPTASPWLSTLPERAPGLSLLPWGGCCTTVRFNNNTNTLSSDTTLKSQGSRRAHKGEQLRSHQ